VENALEKRTDNEGKVLALLASQVRLGLADTGRHAPYVRFQVLFISQKAVHARRNCLRQWRTHGLVVQDSTHQMGDTFDEKRAQPMNDGAFTKLFNNDQQAAQWKFQKTIDCQTNH
jgi:hypothetical protein